MPSASIAHTFSTNTSRPAAEPRQDLSETSFDVFETPLARSIHRLRYSLNGMESWRDTARRVVTHVTANQNVTDDERVALTELIASRRFIPGGRYLYSAGRDVHNISNCLLFRAADSREGWSQTIANGMMATMMGGGIGVEYSDVRPKGAPIAKTGGRASGPLSLMHAVNEVMRHVRDGGSRRAAIWAGLAWNHQDVNDFLHAKDWSAELRAMKERDHEFPLPLEYTNISVSYDRAFFDAHARGDAHARSVWTTNCRQAFRAGEPGFSINYRNARENLRNACTEVISEDDSDRCNLGTLWLNRFTTREEFAAAVQLTTLFLMCGGEYTDNPTPKIAEIGRQNNRIGLGLGGFWEWLLMRGCDYEVTPELHAWLEVYRDESDAAALAYAYRLGQNIPKGKRAIAPNGTIGLVAETTSGIEPALCAAYIRRYYRDDQYVQQRVVDAAAQRLLARGVPMERIERNDAYSIDFERRVCFQHDVQRYVDMAISSTCNLPPWGTENNNESTADKYEKILLRYAPGLRGFTCYPDGSRGAQPISKISMEEALRSPDVEAVEHSACAGGVCGS